jgi:hypothetical protein
MQYNLLGAWMAQVAGRLAQKCSQECGALAHGAQERALTPFGGMTQKGQDYIHSIRRNLGIARQLVRMSGDGMRAQFLQGAAQEPPLADFWKNFLPPKGDDPSLNACSVRDRRLNRLGLSPVDGKPNRLEGDIGAPLAQAIKDARALIEENPDKLWAIAGAIMVAGAGRRIITAETLDPSRYIYIHNEKDIQKSLQELARAVERNQDNWQSGQRVAKEVRGLAGHIQQIETDNLTCALNS